MSDFFADEKAGNDEAVAQWNAYRAHPGLNQSTAWQLLSKSPRHAWDYRNRVRGVGGDPDHSRDREIGTVTHALILGATSRIHEIDAADYRGKGAQEIRRQCEEKGVTPILAPDFARARRACSAVLEQLEGFGLRLDGESEQPLYWSESGLECKALLDHVCADGRTIIDIKSGQDANPQGLLRRIVGSGYHVQAAAYCRALDANGTPGPARFFDVFVETSGLVQVVPVEIAGSLLELGERMWLRACRTWAECLAEGIWPGYTTGILRPAAPAWALAADVEAEMAEGEAAE